MDATDHAGGSLGSDPTGPSPAPSPSRSRGRSALIGLAVGVGVAAMTFALIAVPFYTLASFEPDGGLDRPIVRNGLFRLALPVALLLGVIVGVVTAWWMRRGGSWTVDDGGDRYSAH